LASAETSSDVEPFEALRKSGFKAGTSEGNPESVAVSQILRARAKIVTPAGDHLSQRSVLAAEPSTAVIRSWSEREKRRARSSSFRIEAKEKRRM